MAATGCLPMVSLIAQFIPQPVASWQLWLRATNHKFRMASPTAHTPVVIRRQNAQRSDHFAIRIAV